MNQGSGRDELLQSFRLQSVLSASLPKYYRFHCIILHAPAFITDGRPTKFHISFSPETRMVNHRICFIAEKECRLSLRIRKTGGVPFLLCSVFIYASPFPSMAKSTVSCAICSSWRTSAPDAILVSATPRAVLNSAVYCPYGTVGTSCA